MTETIRAFFAFNSLIILFIYGQVFFVLGLAIALQSWRHSRLALARNLNWLAAFGFAHGLNEWGDVFIPIQAQYLPALIVYLLLVAQMVLLAFSFACLFQFGVESLRPLPGRWRYLRYTPAAILVAWLLWMFIPGFALAGDINAWHRLGSILARYSMGVPGGFLSAYGLRRQARAAIAPLKLDRIVSMLRLAGLALAGYGVMGGMVVPAAPFFPANILNQDRLQELTLLPVQVYRGLLCLVLTYALIRALEVFRVELDHRITNMEETQMLKTERERIGRDLHDGTLQTVYASGLLLRSVEHKLRRGDIEEGTKNLQQSITLLDQAVTDIRGYIGQLRPQPTGQNLVAGLKELANSFHIRSLVDVELKLDLPPDLTLAPVQIGHLLAIANEAMSNVARHAQATQIVLSSSVVDQSLGLQIEDNGQGLPSDLVVGYGLSNMRDRARLLGGEIYVHSIPGAGTSVRVDIPIGDSHETRTPHVGG